jgi:serine/threonine-protein kinase RsbT
MSELLLRFLSPVTADSVIRRALREANLTAVQVSPDSFDRLVPHLERGIRLFVASDQQERARTELAQLGRRSLQMPPPQTIRVTTEADISDARMAARALCGSLGARSIGMQKVATIVSELARNIVSYTTGGSIELIVTSMSPAKIQIRAIDKGRGIPNLTEVLSGNYKSKTGLGKGLLGVKRLSEAFDIQTDKDGTRIDVSVNL